MFCLVEVCCVDEDGGPLYTCSQSGVAGPRVAVPDPRPSASTGSPDAEITHNVSFTHSFRGCFPSSLGPGVSYFMVTGGVRPTCVPAKPPSLQWSLLVVVVLMGTDSQVDPRQRYEPTQDFEASGRVSSVEDFWVPLSVTSVPLQ